MRGHGGGQSAAARARTPHGVHGKSRARARRWHIVSSRPATMANVPTMRAIGERYLPILTQALDLRNAKQRSITLVRSGDTRMLARSSAGCGS